MPKPRKPAPAAQAKPKIMTCMGLVDADDVMARYCGPLRRADGAAAYNGYFWPLAEDDFWAWRDLGHRWSSRWHVCVIALADGTWLAEGWANRAVQYPTREAALRVAVARMLRTMRSARRWTGPIGVDRLSYADFRTVATWALGLVGRPAPRVRAEPPPPPPAPPPPAWSDLPLFAAPEAPIAATTAGIEGQSS